MSISGTLIRRPDRTANRHHRRSPMSADSTTAATTDIWRAEAQGAGAYADVNGLHLYYETFDPAGRRGGTSNPPLILLHGGLGSGEMFGPIVAMLAQDRQVIAIDLQGHGRT